MKKTLIIFLPLLLLLPTLVSGHEIVIVMDAERPSYQQALNGFTKACNCHPAPVQGIKSIHPATPHKVIINQQNTEETIAHIRSFRPDLILAIGNRGLQAAIQVPDVPIIYLLVANPERIIGNQNNITGIELKISAALQLKVLHEHLPKIKKLGVIYDPRHTGDIIDEATIAAPAQSITLLTRPLGHRGRFQEILEAMLADKIDAFWMVPDTTVLTPATLQQLILFSLENKIPVITFADKYLQQGAAVSITFDLWAAGVQAGKIASSVLNGTPIASIPPQTINKTIVHKNDRILEKLGVATRNLAQQGETP